MDTMNIPTIFRNSVFSLYLTMIALALGCATLSAPQTTTLNLTGTQEVPPVTTSAAGTGQITVLPDRSVSGGVTVTGVTPTVAHIHEGATGINGPVIVPLMKTTENTFTVPTGTKLTESQHKAFQAGHLYVNVHSAAFPNGEIRAQIAPAPADKRFGY
jgi:hypothetical protein